MSFGDEMTRIQIITNLVYFVPYVGEVITNQSDRIPNITAIKPAWENC